MKRAATAIALILGSLAVAQAYAGNPGPQRNDHHERAHDRRDDRRDMHRDNRQDHRFDRRDHRQDHRYDRRDHRQDHRFDHRNDHRDHRWDNRPRNFHPSHRPPPRYHYHGGHYHRPPGYYHRAWHRGDYLPPVYRSHGYVVHDYGRYHLHRPPHGHHWVRVDNDVVLTAIATGVITSVVLNHFY